MTSVEGRSRQSNERHNRILVVRPDRVGDVVLSTPVFEVLKKHYPDSHLTVMVREGVAPIVRGLPSVDEVMIYDPDDKHAGLGGLFQLIHEVREKNFRISVVLQSQWQIAAALFAAGVKYRVGPVSKPHSYLFYNRGIRQRRSRVEMHETDYNLQLLRRLGVRVGTRSVSTQIHVAEEARTWATAWLKAKGWEPEAAESSVKKHLVLVHPGMGGSALNWPEANYIELIKLLVQSGNSVLVTCGPAELGLMERVTEALGPLSASVIFYGGPEVGSLGKLAALMEQASVAVAPSTGPLHMAVALGKPVVTFFPPIRVQSAIRWGPYIADESRASIQVPEVYCGQDFKCLGRSCNYFPCMKSLQVSDALEKVRQHLSRI